jgi:hypothetical protein
MTDLGQSEATDRVFRSLLRQAKDRVLYVSPPYADEKAQVAFLTGYETALKDLAKGELQMPRNAEVP